MATIKANENTLRRLKESGMDIKLPEPVNKVIEVPKEKLQDTPIEAQPVAQTKKKWEFAIERDWEGLITKVIVTEI